jgi:hypothetical protein
VVARGLVARRGQQVRCFRPEIGPARNFHN